MLYWHRPSYSCSRKIITAPEGGHQCFCWAKHGGENGFGLQCQDLSSRISSKLGRYLSFYLSRKPSAHNFLVEVRKNPKQDGTPRVQLILLQMNCSSSLYGVHIMNMTSRHCWVERYAPFFFLVSRGAAYRNINELCLLGIFWRFVFAACVFFLFFSFYLLYLLLSNEHLRCNVGGDQETSNVTRFLYSCFSPTLIFILRGIISESACERMPTVVTRDQLCWLLWQ